MALREAGVIVARREGRFVYYSLLDPQLLELIRLAAGLSGVTGADLAGGPADPPHACACPKCSGVPVISLAEISTLSQA
jgi:hypothetical protein